MGVHINQDDDGYMGLRGVDQDDGAFIFASAEYNASSVDKTFFVAPRAVRVVGITLRVTAAGTDGSAVSVMTKKVPSGTAIGSGTDLMTAALNLKGTANTNQVGALSTTAGALDVAAGNALALDFTGTLTTATGVVTVAMCPL
jgi:hypothetical protein